LARLLATSGAGARGDLVAARRAGTDVGAASLIDEQAAARRSAWRWGLLVGAGWLVLAALRAWFSRSQTVPLANPDESAYLIAARILAGGPAADFSYSTLYQGGYPLLITPVFWLTHNPVTAYHGVLTVNALVSAGLMPLAYVAGRRLGLFRPAAYAVAVATALLPAGFIYSEYAMTDAIFPVLVLAWLLTVHSWLTARTPRGQYAAAAGSAVLVGYAYAVHSRGLVILAGYLAVGVLVFWRRLAPRRTVAVAALAAAASVGAGWLLDRYLLWTIYPEGTRSLEGQMAQRLRNVNGALNVFEMAAGQLWRLVLDSWGLAGIGLFAAIAVIAWRGFRADLRIMAALCVAVTLVTACTAPAALPSDQSQTWASGRYLDGMIVTFFLAGAVVLLRMRPRFVLVCAACTVALTALSAVTVAVYAGSSLPTSIFPTGFNFAEPAVLTQNWTSANVYLASAVAVGLLALWILLALAARRWSAVVVRPGAHLSRALRVSGSLRVAWVLRAALAAGLAVVSVVAVAQVTSHVSQAFTPAQAANTSGFVTASGLRAGEQVAVAGNVSYSLWAPQAFEVSWTELEFFDPPQSPPAGTDVVETAWQAGQPASASWPQAPAGWHIVAASQAGGWVAWRHS
jgi:hypothetical protein